MCIIILRSYLAGHQQHADHDRGDFEKHKLGRGMRPHVGYFFVENDPTLGIFSEKQPIKTTHVSPPVGPYHYRSLTAL